MITDVDLKNCIKEFTESVHDILDGKLQSVYLYGSVVLQDYKDGWSDIDLIFFTTENRLPIYGSLFFHQYSFMPM